MITFLVFLAGFTVGYWFYFWRMFYKLYKLKKHLDEAEKLVSEMIMETRSFVEPDQWNEDKL